MYPDSFLGAAAAASGSSAASAASAAASASAAGASPSTTTATALATLAFLGFSAFSAVFLGAADRFFAFFAVAGAVDIFTTPLTRSWRTLLSALATRPMSELRTLPNSVRAAIHPAGKQSWSVLTTAPSASIWTISIASSLGAAGAGATSAGAFATTAAMII